MVKSYSLQAGLLEDLLALHTEASAEEEHEVAHHLLMAALHLANSLGDEKRIEAVRARLRGSGAAGARAAA